MRTVVDIGRLTEGAQISTAELRELLDQAGTRVASYVSLRPGAARVVLVRTDGHRLLVTVTDS
jgi:hypothetical protein